MGDGGVGFSFGDQLGGGERIKNPSLEQAGVGGGVGGVGGGRESYILLGIWGWGWRSQNSSISILKSVSAFLRPP